MNTAPSDGPGLEIRRHLPASPDRVWRAWTDPDEVRRWSGPHGFTVTDYRADARVGGTWRLVMTSAEWGEMAQGGVFRVIEPPRHLEYTFAWENADGTPDREMLVTVTFAASGDGTEMTFTQATFENEPQRDSHVSGWSEAFEKFAAYLEETPVASG